MPRLSSLRAHADSLKLDGRVLFPGHVSDADLAVLMRQAAGLHLSTRGLACCIIDAMAFDCPIPCSRVGVLSEVAGAAATLFNPAVTTEIALAMVDLVWVRPRAGGKGACAGCFRCATHGLRLLADFL